jgi:hypothetical protein
MAGSSITPAPRNSDVVVENFTYGVELELVFAFHRNKLELSENSNAVKDTIVKNMRYADREEATFTPISLVDLPGCVYNSWGISHIDSVSRRRKAIPYGIEPIRIMGRYLHELCPRVEFRITTAPTEEEKTKDKYAQWLITADHSVCGVGSENIPTRLSHVDKAGAEDWDSYGIELVSRDLNSNVSKDKREIAKVVDALEPDDRDRFGAFITNQYVNLFVSLHSSSISMRALYHRH